MATADLSAAAAVAPKRKLPARLAAVLAGLWATGSGLAPHVLHHVGPLAGAALFAGAGGTALFAAVGFVVSVPFLLRMRRRFASWWAPGIALGVMVALFSVSAWVVGPLISGRDEPARNPGVEQPGEHAEHH